MARIVAASCEEFLLQHDRVAGRRRESGDMAGLDRFGEIAAETADDQFVGRCGLAGCGQSDRRKAGVKDGGFAHGWRPCRDISGSSFGKPRTDSAFLSRIIFTKGI
ncbi:hypothetical protein QWZ10_23465 [Paracoccus cavernae]|uniref:Uncharacterized protein n=1 Tax=Paracoccus cavernae TaxID=1571207 RepID=A0ABT8DCC8_9RHOB|nr:hypothetical protein [Paracoccus cavernae]